MLNFVTYLSIFFILLVSAVAAYRDFKFGKIPNELIIVAFCGGLILLVFSVLTGILPVNFFWQSLLNAVVALALGYAFWYFDLWAAGDAKLFFVLALLLPLRFYWRNFLPIFPSLVILINALIPLLIFVVLQSIFLVIKKIALFFKQDKLRVRLEGGVRKFFQQMRINSLSYLWVVFVFGLILVVFQLLRLETETFMNRFVWGRGGLFFIMASLGMMASRVAKNKKVILTAAAGLVVYLLVRQLFSSQNLFLVVALLTKGSIPYLVGIVFLGWLFSFYENNSQNKNLHFAFWLFLSVVLTMALNGSLLLLR